MFLLYGFDIYGYVVLYFLYYACYLILESKDILNG